MNKISKIIIIILAMFSFSGCYVEYNISINDNVVKENVNFVEAYPTSNFSTNVGKAMQYHTSIFYSQNQNFFEKDTDPGYIEYEKKQITNGISLDSEYSIISFFGGTVLKNCYDDVSHTIEDGYLNITTSNELKCFTKFGSNTGVKVTLKTDYKISDSNADLKNSDGSLTWIITENNYTNHPIAISIMDGYDDKSSYEKPEDYESLHTSPNEDYLSSYEPYESQPDWYSVSIEREKYSQIIEEVKEGNNVLYIILYVLIGITLIGSYIFYKIYKKNHNNQ